MQIILLTTSMRGGRRIHLGGTASAALLALFLGLVGAGAVAGYLFAEHAPANARRALYAAAWRAEVGAERERVGRAVEAARADLDALAVRLGELQARAVRVDALGSRLVEMAGLDGGEFDFAEPPPRGGPAASDAEPFAVADFVGALEALAATLEDRETKLRAVEVALMGRELDEEMQPRGRPVESGWLSSRFGRRTDPINGKREYHEGLDFAGRPGTEVVAVAAGVVIWSGPRLGYGRVVEIDHGRGLVTRYAHNRKNLVRVGEAVRKGQRIALMGASGRATGTHVHFEVRKDGRPVDPMEFIRAKR